MNRRSFLTALLAVPLAAVGVARRPPVRAIHKMNLFEGSVVTFPPMKADDLELLRSRKFSVEEISSYWMPRSRGEDV